MSVETSLMIIAICVLFLSVSLIILIACAVKVLLALQERGKEVLLQGTEVVDKIKENIDATKPIFHSMAKMGAMVCDFTHKYKKTDEKPFTATIQLPRKEKKNKILDFLEVIGLSILIWQKLKKDEEEN